MSRRGVVFLSGKRAGLIEQRPETYLFTYDPIYLQEKLAKKISFSFPLREKPYESETFFPFFDGLIPEGWLLSLTIKTWELDKNDRMGLLLTVCEDCIGAVSVVESSRYENLEIRHEGE